jgi:hypothetical protein
MRMSKGMMRMSKAMSNEEKYQLSSEEQYLIHCQQGLEMVISGAMRQLRFLHSTVYLCEQCRESGNKEKLA